MDLAGYVVNAVVVEKRSVAEVAQAHGVSRSWLYELLARYREGGEEGLKARSRRPLSSPRKVSAAMEAEIVELRKSLAEDGLDAGAATIHYHLLCRHRRRKKSVPSVAMIWRVLKAKGFVVPQPHKAPQLLEAVPGRVAQRDVAGRRHWGLPASMLTHNGAIFIAESRNGRCAMENELARLGVAYKHSRPYHPQTCGKVERFHQTLKKHLARQPKPATVAELQAQLDGFAAYYNAKRPHRALGRRTPAEAFAARTKATPKAPAGLPEGHHRVRRDRIDKSGTVSLRYRSKLLHIGVGRIHAGVTVLLLVDDLDVRVITEDGELSGN